MKDRRSRQCGGGCNWHLQFLQNREQSIWCLGLMAAACSEMTHGWWQLGGKNFLGKAWASILKLYVTPFLISQKMGRVSVHLSRWLLMAEAPCERWRPCKLQGECPRAAKGRILPDSPWQEPGAHPCHFVGLGRRVSGIRQSQNGFAFTPSSAWKPPPGIPAAPYRYTHPAAPGKSHTIPCPARQER